MQKERQATTEPGYSTARLIGNTMRPTISSIMETWGLGYQKIVRNAPEQNIWLTGIMPPSMYAIFSMPPGLADQGAALVTRIVEEKRNRRARLELGKFFEKGILL